MDRNREKEYLELEHSQQHPIQQFEQYPPPTYDQMPQMNWDQLDLQARRQQFHHFQPSTSNQTPETTWGQLDLQLRRQERHRIQEPTRDIPKPASQKQQKAKHAILKKIRALKTYNKKSWRMAADVIAHVKQSNLSSGDKRALENAIKEEFDELRDKVFGALHRSTRNELMP